ncbi:hypothetical protein QZH41_002705, partial [Actinostola sp. cb2023]
MSRVHRDFYRLHESTAEELAKSLAMLLLAVDNDYSSPRIHPRKMKLLKAGDHSRDASAAKMVNKRDWDRCVEKRANK